MQRCAPCHQDHTTHRGEGAKKLRGSTASLCRVLFGLEPSHLSFPSLAFFLISATANTAAFSHCTTCLLSPSAACESQAAGHSTHIHGERWHENQEAHSGEVCCVPSEENNARADMVKKKRCVACSYMAKANPLPLSLQTFAHADPRTQANIGL